MTEHNGNFIPWPCWVNGLEFYNITKKKLSLKKEEEGKKKKNPS